MAKKNQWIGSKYDKKSRTLTINIKDERIDIPLDGFSADDLDALVVQGILVKVQRATAGKKSHATKVEAAVRKAKELALGKLVSDKTSIVNAVTAKTIAKMKEVGFTDEQIREVFPDWNG